MKEKKSIAEKIIEDWITIAKGKVFVFRGKNKEGERETK